MFMVVPHSRQKEEAHVRPTLVIDVVDNGGQWTHREWRMLRYLKVDTQIIDNTTRWMNFETWTASFFRAGRHGLA